MLGVRSAPKKKRASETRDIVKPALEALNKIASVNAWRNNTGQLRDVNGRPVQYGLAVGSSDIIGICGPKGRFLALEVKRPGKEPTVDQELFMAEIRNRGGFACVVRSVDEALDAVERAMMGDSQ